MFPEIVMTVMGSSRDEWYGDNGDLYMLLRDRNHPSPDSEDEVGRYKARYFRLFQEFEDVSNSTLNPYLMELKAIQ